MVASCAVYSDVLSDAYPGEFGRLAATPDELYRAIVDAVMHRETALHVAERWRQRVFERHSYETQWRRWEQAIVEVLDLFPGRATVTAS